jgi:hypothetical protein
MRGWHTSRSVAGLSFMMGVSTEYPVLTSGKLRTAPRGIPLMYKSSEAVVPKNSLLLPLDRYLRSLT